MGLLVNGLLAELPAILDRFSTVPQVIIYRGGWLGVVRSHGSGGGWSGVVGSHGGGWLNARQVFTLPNGHICAVDSTKGSQTNG